MVSLKFWRKTLCESLSMFLPVVRYRMFEVHMDEEIEWVKHAFAATCKGWGKEASLFRDSCVSDGLSLLFAS